MTSALNWEEEFVCRLNILVPEEVEGGVRWSRAAGVVVVEE